MIAKHILFGAAALALTTACTPREQAAPETAPPPPAGDTASCGADKVVSYVGVVATDEVLAKIKSASGAQSLRAVGPDDMMTQDFRVDRLTIYKDASGRITQFRCV